MKDKFRNFMFKYGFSLIIAFVAVGAYFLIIDVADRYFDSKKQTYEIVLNSDNTLSVNYGGDKEDVYIYWETDAGRIEPVKGNNNFRNLSDSAESGYYTYTGVDESVKWTDEDADGNSYSSATIRAVLYVQSEGENVYYIGDFISEHYLTFTNENGKIAKAEDRFFSNPVRKDSGSDWNQIYMIQNNNTNEYTFRYRTGNKMDKDAVKVLCWQNADGILSETDLFSGAVPSFSILDSNKNKTMLKAVNTVSCDISENSGTSFKIQAYLIDESVYKKSTIKDSEKEYLAELTLNKQ